MQHRNRQGIGPVFCSDGYPKALQERVHTTLRRAEPNAQVVGMSRDAQMHVTTATMTSVLDTLERKGYIRRQPDPVDRRRVLVGLTAEAESLLDQVLPAVQQVVAATSQGRPCGTRRRN